MARNEAVASNPLPAHYLPLMLLKSQRNVNSTPALSSPLLLGQIQPGRGWQRPGHRAGVVAALSPLLWGAAGTWLCLIRDTLRCILCALGYLGWVQVGLGMVPGVAPVPAGTDGAHKGPRGAGHGPLGAGGQRQIVSPGCSWLPAGDRQRVPVPQGSAWAVPHSQGRVGSPELG